MERLKGNIYIYIYIYIYGKIGEYTSYKHNMLVAMIHMGCKMIFKCAINGKININIAYFVNFYLSVFTFIRN